MSKIKLLLLFVFTLIMGLSFILFSAAASDGARNGLSFCGQILIPSLFPFMVLSTFIVRSGLSLPLGKILDPITKFLFKLPGCAAAAIIISFIGGYPTGAKGIRSLVDKSYISDSQAEQMLLFCVGAGPGFIINVVGLSLLSNFKLGIILFLSQTFSSLIIGIVSGFIYKNKNIKKTQKFDSKLNNLSSALINSCTDTIIAVLNMCAFIVIFSTVLSILNSSNLSHIFANLMSNVGVPSSISKSLIAMILEVTSGCNTAAALKVPIEIMSFFIGFASMCIHFQVFSFMEGVKFSKLKFIIARVAHGLLAAVITHFILIIYPQSLEVIFSNSVKVIPSISSNIMGSISLLALCAVFLLSLDDKKLDIKSKI